MMLFSHFFIQSVEVTRQIERRSRPLGELIKPAALAVGFMTS